MTAFVQACIVRTKGNQGSIDMKRPNLARTLVASLLAIGMTGQASAAALDALQGAWTMNGTDCADTFKSVGGKVEYIDRTATVTTGLIVTGSKIEGPNGVCTAEKIRDEKDHFVASLSCADAVIVDSFSVAFKVIDAEHFQRFDPQFPEAAVIYQKCTF
jgi:hypothetical protein